VKQLSEIELYREIRNKPALIINIYFSLASSWESE